jgi:hypothetical protein
MFDHGLSEAQKAAFAGGLRQFVEDCRTRFGGRAFTELAAVERSQCLMDCETRRPTPGFYRLVKEFTVLGYFTSEIGATQAMVHIPIPGRYDGDVTILPGTRAWSD